MNFIKNNALAAVALVIAIIALGGYVYPIASNLGAFDIPTRFPNGHLDTNGGYYVDGTAIIDGDGNVDGVITTSSITTSGTSVVVDGVTLTTDSMTMQTATSSLCYFGPITATTTLDKFVVAVTTGTSTAALIDLATSTSRYATTSASTLFVNQEIAANTSGTISYISSGLNTAIIVPGETLLVRAQSTLLGGYTYGGSCFYESSN